MKCRYCGKEIVVGSPYIVVDGGEGDKVFCSGTMNPENMSKLPSIGSEEERKKQVAEQGLCSLVYLRERLLSGHITWSNRAIRRR